LVWYDAAHGSNDIYYKKSTDGGSNWTGSQRITWSSNWSIYPALAFDSSDNIHVVWCQNSSGNYEVYHKSSTDGGTTWGGSKRLTWNSGRSYVPEIAIDSNDNLHVVWDDDTPGIKEVYYKRSTNSGTSWTTDRLSWNLGTSEYPNIALDSNNDIYVVWANYIPFNFEIFYKQGIQ
jgi:hypothetical protein